MESKRDRWIPVSDDVLRGLPRTDQVPEWAGKHEPGTGKWGRRSTESAMADTIDEAGTGLGPEEDLSDLGDTFQSRSERNNTDELGRER